MPKLATDEVAAITRMLQTRLQALRAKDSAALTADYAAELLSFDLAPMLQHARRPRASSGVVEDFRVGCHGVAVIGRTGSR